MGRQFNIQIHLNLNPTRVHDDQCHPVNKAQIQAKAFSIESPSPQPGPFSTVEYSVEGAYADYVTFENPLEGTLVLSKALDFETLQTFEVVIVARDQGGDSIASK